MTLIRSAVEPPLPENVTPPPVIQTQAVSYRMEPAIFYVVLLAVAVRIGFMLVFRTFHFDAGIDDLAYQVETTNIARSIVTGHGFSSPFGAAYTGPTAWIAPVYPYFCALIFTCCGVFSRTSAIVLMSFQSLLSGLTCIPILGVGMRTVGRRAAWLAAVTWAIFPWFSKWPVSWVWEISLSALLLSSLFWYTLVLEQNAAPRLRLWIGYGALWGFALLVNPALLTFLPVALGWWVYSLHRLRRSWLTGAGVSLLICLVMISPWLVRNRLVFGHWTFLRSNFPFEFALGNYHLSFGRGWGRKHPMNNVAELAAYHDMGELAYVAWKGNLSRDFVRQYPMEFVTLTAKRVLYFWDGSAMQYRGVIASHWWPWSFAALSFATLPALLLAHRIRIHAWQLFLGTLLLYPVPYYLTFSQARYRHAIEPLMLLLISFLTVEILEAGQTAGLSLKNRFA